MKRLVWVAAVTGLLALDWAALHDVLSGEPDVRQEYAVLALSAVAFILLLWKAWRLRRAGQG